MDGRKISASPRPCNGRRVLAKKRPRGGGDGFVNSVKKLQRREICSKRDRAFSMTNAQERFRNIRLQEEYDTYDPKGHCGVVLSFLKKRSKIIEIVAAHDIVFALAQSGVCAAFSRESNQRICFLNVSSDEVIRSLFYNKNNDSLITVSVYAADNFSSLKCRSTRIEYIKRGKPDAGFALFESESLKWPGFVEFDDVNGKVLTYSAQDSIYKVFDLKNYTMLYSISNKNVQEIKISPGIMLLIFEKASGHVPLKILSIEDGTVLKTFNHLLHRNKKVDFIEQFNEKLLVKQENENLQILDVRNFELTEVSRAEFMTPSAFIFLYENQLFLTFRDRTVAVWNFRGELVTSFEDHLLWHPDCNTNNIYITSDQDLIISYCKADSDDPLSEGNVIGHAAGSINISNILTGKCLAKIRASNSFPIAECSCSGCCSGKNCSSTNLTLQLTADGRLILQSPQGQSIPIVETSNISSASMLDTGNFVLYNFSQKRIWQSFDYPTDTILPGQTLSGDRDQELVSAASETDHSSGIFKLRMQSDGNLVQYPVEKGYPYAYWSSDTYGKGPNVTLNLNNNGSLYLLDSGNVVIWNVAGGRFPKDDTIFLMRIDSDGIFRVYSYEKKGSRTWTSLWQAPDNMCAPRGLCGFNSICVPKGNKTDCKCLPGYDFINPDNRTSGCQRNFFMQSCRDQGRSVEYSMTLVENVDCT